jgi:protein SCO1
MIITITSLDWISLPAARPLKNGKRMKTWLHIIALLAAFSVGPACAADEIKNLDLIDGDGKRVTETDLRDVYSIIFFGYTKCPDICPMALSKVSAALKKLPADTLDKVLPVFISLDPSRDSGFALKKYATAFHPKFLALTGPKEQIEKTAYAYQVYFSKHLSKDPDNYLVDHTSLIYFQGPNGENLGVFSAKSTNTEIANIEPLLPWFGLGGI